MKQYVGKTEQELKQRHYGHRREIETKSSLLGKHFADSCGYTSFRIQVSGEFQIIYTVGALHKCIESNELSRMWTSYAHRIRQYVKTSLRSNNHVAYPRPSTEGWYQFIALRERLTMINYCHRTEATLFKIPFHTKSFKTEFGNCICCKLISNFNFFR